MALSFIFSIFIVFILHTCNILLLAADAQETYLDIQEIKKASEKEDWQQLYLLTKDKKFYDQLDRKTQDTLSGKCFQRLQEKKSLENEKFFEPFVRHLVAQLPDEREIEKLSHTSDIDVEKIRKAGEKKYWKELYLLTEGRQFYDKLDVSTQAILAVKCTDVLQNQKWIKHSYFWQFLEHFLTQIPNITLKKLKVGLLGEVAKHGYYQPEALKIVNLGKKDFPCNVLYALLKKINDQASHEYFLQQKNQINQLLEQLRVESPFHGICGKILLVKKESTKDILQELFKINKETIFNYNPHKLKEFLYSVEKMDIEAIFDQSNAIGIQLIKNKFQEILYLLRSIDIDSLCQLNNSSKNKAKYIKTTLKNVKGFSISVEQEKKLFFDLIDVQKSFNSTTPQTMATWVHDRLKDSYARLSSIYRIHNIDFVLKMARALHDTTAEISELFYYLLSTKALEKDNNPLPYFNRLIELACQDNYYAFMASVHLITFNPMLKERVHDSTEYLRLWSISLNSKHFAYPGRWIDLMSILDQFPGNQKINIQEDKLKEYFDIWVSRLESKDSVLEIEKDFRFWKALRHRACKEYQKAFEIMQQLLSDVKKKKDINTLIVQAYIKIFESLLNKPQASGDIAEIYIQLVKEFKSNSDGRQFWLLVLKHQLENYYAYSLVNSNSMVKINMYLSNVEKTVESHDIELLNPYFFKLLLASIGQRLKQVDKQDKEFKKLLDHLYPLLEKIIDDPKTSSMISDQLHIICSDILVWYVYKGQSSIDKIKDLQKAIEHCEFKKTIEMYLKLSNLYTQLSYETNDINNIHKALDCFKKAFKLFEKHEDPDWTVVSFLKSFNSYIKLYAKNALTFLLDIDHGRHRINLEYFLTQLSYLLTDHDHTINSKVRETIHEVLKMYMSLHGFNENEMIELLKKLFKKYPGYAEFIMGDIVAENNVVVMRPDGKADILWKQQYDKGCMDYHIESVQAGFSRALIRTIYMQYVFETPKSTLKGLDDKYAQKSPSIKAFISLMKLWGRSCINVYNLPEEEIEELKKIWGSIDVTCALSNYDVTEALTDLADLVEYISSTKLSLNELENIEEIILHDKCSFISKIETIHIQNKQVILLGQLFLKFIVVSDENRKLIVNEIFNHITTMQAEFNHTVMHADKILCIMEHITTRILQDMQVFPDYEEDFKRIKEKNTMLRAHLNEYYA